MCDSYAAKANVNEGLLKDCPCGCVGHGTHSGPARQAIELRGSGRTGYLLDNSARNEAKSRQKVFESYGVQTPKFTKAHDGDGPASTCMRRGGIGGGMDCSQPLNHKETWRGLAAN